jgi:hypothetical protein
MSKESIQHWNVIFKDTCVCSIVRLNQGKTEKA